MKQNYYGSLCTAMYEILHAAAPRDELDFYLSYARPGMKILEPLCGSGRFLVPFLERGMDISGVDNSGEMLAQLKQKAPGAKVTLADITAYATVEKFDYIFISSGSVSLFTDRDLCKLVLSKMKDLLAPSGKFVFAVDTVACRCHEDPEYKIAVSVKTREGYDLLLKNKDHYDELTQTQFSPSLYELYNGNTLLQKELMDFQTHLYRFGELEQLLKQIGFRTVITYSDFNKQVARDEQTEMFLYECSI